MEQLQSAAPNIVEPVGADAVILSISDLHVQYTAAGQTIHAVRGANLDIRRGERFGIAGESGSGKTALVNAILRLLPETARISNGSIYFNDADLTRLDDRSLTFLRWTRIALIPQGSMSALNPVMKVGSQIADRSDKRKRLPPERPSALHVAERIAAAGANLRPFMSVDRRYHRLEARIDEAPADERARLLPDLASIIDEGFGVLETVQAHLIKHGTIATPFEGDASGVQEGGDVDAEGPMFQRDIHNTGYTEAPGPRHGLAAWKFPVGLGWYARPVVVGSKVYVASPGMHTTCFCLDLASGEEIWTSTKEHPIFGIYRYPAIASTPFILDDRIILRDVNSHWGNDSQAKYLHYIDKSSFEPLARKYAWACRLSNALCARRNIRQRDGLSLRRSRHLPHAGPLSEFQPLDLRQPGQQFMALGFQCRRH